MKYQIGETYGFKNASLTIVNQAVKDGVIYYSVTNNLIKKEIIVTEQAIDDFLKMIPKG